MAPTHSKISELSLFHGKFRKRNNAKPVEWNIPVYLLINNNIITAKSSKKSGQMIIVRRLHKVWIKLHTIVPQLFFWIFLTLSLNLNFCLSVFLSRSAQNRIGKNNNKSFPRFVRRSMLIQYKCVQNKLLVSHAGECEFKKKQMLFGLSACFQLLNLFQLLSDTILFFFASGDNFFDKFFSSRREINIFFLK